VINGVFFMDQMSFLLLNRQCQSTERNMKHLSQPVAWPRLFFIHHWIPDGRDIVPFVRSPVSVL